MKHRAEIFAVNGPRTTEPGKHEQTCQVRQLATRDAHQCPERATHRALHEHVVCWMHALPSDDEL